MWPLLWLFIIQRKTRLRWNLTFMMFLWINSQRRKIWGRVWFIINCNNFVQLHYWSLHNPLPFSWLCASAAHQLKSLSLFSIRKVFSSPQDLQLCANEAETIPLLSVRSFSLLTDELCVCFVCQKWRRLALTSHSCNVTQANSSPLLFVRPGAAQYESLCPLVSMV